MEKKMTVIPIEILETWAQGVMTRQPDFVVGDAQLLRWWIVPRNFHSNVYLHRICKSDEDRAFHDHPWDNRTLVISGRYIEHTPEGRFIRNAGDIIDRQASAMHRLEIAPGEEAITLFTTGPAYRDWGFDCPQGWVHWRDFTDPKNPGDVGRGCGEQ